RTVLITTHYMDEAERLCDRVAIVDHGKVIALGSPHDLIASLGGEHVIEFGLEAGGETDANFEAELRTLPSVTALRHEADRLALTVGEPHKAIPALLELTARTSRSLGSLTTRHASLEDVFVTQTGRSLRDE
ncbi:MAG: ABC transporter ATP-binding protein, partial [Acidobacteriota bacterium]